LLLNRVGAKVRKTVLGARDPVRRPNFISRRRRW
jgi:hypothetical protein